MRWSTVVSEAFANLYARRTPAMLLATTAALVCFSPALIEIAGLADLQKTHLSDEAHGAQVVVITDPKEPLSASECDHVARWSGVDESGWFRASGTAFVDTAPRDPFVLATASGSFISALGGNPLANSGIALGTAASIELGARVGDSLEVNGRRTIVTSIVPDNLLAPEQARWIYGIQASSQAVSECWVFSGRGMQSAVAQSIRAAFRPSETIETESLATGRFDAAALSWQRRLSQFAWLIAGVVLGLMSALVLFLERNSMALYIVYGAGQPKASTIYSAYCFVAISVGLTVSLAASLLVAWLAVVEWRATAISLVFAAAIGTAAVGASIAALSSIALSFRNMAAAQRERG